MINKTRIATKPFRERFGTIKGSLLWLALFKEKIIRTGSLFSVRIPGIENPIYLRAKTSDVEAFCQIFIHGELNVKIKHSVNYIIDAGANIGLASVYFVNKFPGVSIDALEVDANNIDVFKLNTRNYPNINCIPKGLWGCISNLRITNPDAEPWAFQVEETDDIDPMGFPATTIADLMDIRKTNRVDILKIDIEGSEKEVFESDTSWLDNVGTLFIELHDRLKDGCSTAVFNACLKNKHSKSTVGEYHVFEFF